MVMTRKLIRDSQQTPPSSRDALTLLDSINRRLGYLLVTIWVAAAAAAALWVIREALVIAGW